MARLNVSVVATGIPEEVNKYKIVFLKLQKPKNIWTKKMSCRQFLERGCPQPSGSPPFPGSASIRQVISSTQDNTLPHTEAKATFFSGTYQCSVLRRCDPVPKAKETLEDDPVAITKSLYMKVTIATLILVVSHNTKTFKPGVRFSWWPTRSGRRQKIWLHDRIENMFPTQVYEYPDYQPDLVVVISAFGVTFVILLVGNLKSNGKIFYDIRWASPSSAQPAEDPAISENFVDSQKMLLCYLG